MRLRYISDIASAIVIASGCLSLQAPAPSLAAGAAAVAGTAPGASGAQRLFVLTDIEADPDDTQSLVRLLLYSNEIDIEGLAAVTSLPQPDRVLPASIHAVIDQYAKVRANLLLHEGGYPSAEGLHTLVTEGPALYGMKGVGVGHDSPASRALMRALQRPDPRPLWVSVWAGPAVLAQVLGSIESTMPAAEAAALYGKLRVYSISDQDDSGPWIRSHFPSVFYIVTPWSWGRATWMGMSSRLPHSDLEVVSNEWIAHHIQQGHGPLGAAYPDVAFGMEGDTPAFLGLIPNGLNDMEHPNWGGWGGRYELYVPRLDAQVEAGAVGPNVPETRPIWTNATDDYEPPSQEPPPPGPPSRPAPRPPAFKVQDNYVTLWRWRSAFQNDFAARIEWTTKKFAEANHPPVVRLAGPAAITVHSGERFDLDASGSSDPDGDSLSYYWFQYHEAGSYDGVVSFEPLSPKLKAIRGIRAPGVTDPKTIHFIVAVTDKATPALTRYGRVVVTVLPR